MKVLNTGVFRCEDSVLSEDGDYTFSQSRRGRVLHEKLYKLFQVEKGGESVERSKEGCQE